VGDATREPAWAWALAGLVGFFAWREAGPVPEGPLVSAGDLERWAPRDDPARMTVRDLRRLPGVGERRATAAAQARWTHDPAAGALAWIDVTGIGEITAAGIGAWLAERGLPASTPLMPRAPPPLPPGAAVRHGVGLPALRRGSKGRTAARRTRRAGAPSVVAPPARP
jgi:MYXO-CTERM domain-containing protein